MTNAFELVSPLPKPDPEGDWRAPFKAAEQRGLQGKALKKNATPLEKQAWVIGDVKRRAKKGQLLMCLGAASRCVKCQSVNWGIRAGCACWPDGGWDHEKNVAGGYAMEYGALIVKTPEASEFMTIAEAKASVAKGVPLVDNLNGQPLELPD